MLRKIQKLSIRTQLFGIVVAFTIPFFISVCGLVSINSNSINITKNELKGVRHERDLTSLLYKLIEFKIAKIQKLSGVELSGHSQQNLEAVDKIISEIIAKSDSFTKNLQIYNQKGLRAQSYKSTITDIQRNWDTIKASEKIDPAAFEEILKKIYGLISSIGDASCLILDAELDSYYMMHAAIIALPKAMINISRLDDSIYKLTTKKKEFAKDDNIRILELLKLTKETSIEKIHKDISLALQINSKSSAISSSLQTNIQPYTENYQKKFLSVTDEIESLTTSKTRSLDNYYFTRKSLSSITTKFSDDITNELEVLLQERVNKLYFTMIKIISLSLIGQLVGVFLFWKLASNVVTPIRRLQKIILNFNNNDSAIIVPYKDYDNEIGLIANAVDKLYFTNIERNILQKALTLKSDYLESVLDNARDGIIITTSKGIITDFNKAAENIFGYKEADIVGTDISALMPTESFIRYTNYINEYHKIINGEPINFKTELEGLRKDGRSLPISISLSELKTTKTDNIIEEVFILLVQDITERKKLENKLIEHRNHLQELIEMQTYGLIAAKEYAEAANNHKTEFLSTITHELRTPIHAIINYSKMALKNENPHDETKNIKFLTIVQNSGKRLMYLVNGLLDMSKIEAGKLEYNYETNNFMMLLEQSLAEMESLLYEKNMKIVVNNNCHKHDIYCDGIKIVQVIINIFSNCIKFSPENSSIIVSVNNTEFQDKESLQFIASDEGTGIPEDELELIFEKFNQSSINKSKAGGSGLGLQISRKIILAHQGKIWLENNKAKGTSSFFIIPLNFKGNGHESAPQ